MARYKSMNSLGFSKGVCVCEKGTYVYPCYNKNGRHFRERVGSFNNQNILYIQMTLSKINTISYF